MRKLIVLLLLALVGCDEASYMKTTTYEGHRFITWNRSSGSSGLVHHPDCSCFNRRVEKE